MSSLIDAWPVIGGVASGPSLFVLLYKFVIKALSQQVTLSNAQRDQADERANTQQKRADGLQKENDKLQDRLDAEYDKRRDTDRKLAISEAERIRINSDNVHLLAENARLTGGEVA